MTNLVETTTEDKGKPAFVGTITVDKDELFQLLEFVYGKLWEERENLPLALMQGSPLGGWSRSAPEAEECRQPNLQQYGHRRFLAHLLLNSTLHLRHFRIRGVDNGGSPNSVRISTV